jgi:hypothetical protein
MYPAPLRQESLRLQGQLRFLRPLRRTIHRFFAWGCVCLALCAVSWQSVGADPYPNALAPQWTHMPAGARATYIGIHGGTVPVSLLTSRDGTHMVALVGQTGNDFLRTLKVNPGTRGAVPDALPLPDDEEDAHFAPLHLQASAAPTTPPFAPTPLFLRLTANATLLMAGTAVGAMPVIYATGHSFASLNQLYTDSLLFGISEHSPLLEGAVKAPLKTAKDAKAAKRRPLVRGSSTPY